jgi:uncharacterized protein (TIGR02284 family)
MNNNNQVLNDLVSVTRSGKAFYEYAATTVTDSEIKRTFIRLAKVKSEIVDGLATEVCAGVGNSDRSSTWIGDFIKHYTKIRAALGDKNFAYVAELEDSEGQLSKAFAKVLDDKTTTPLTHSVIKHYMPEVNLCRDILRARKIALKEAASSVRVPSSCPAGAIRDHLVSPGLRQPLASIEARRHCL